MMEVGDRIYYTGDMANMETEGTITRIRPSNQWGPKSYDIKFDESRFDDDDLTARGIYGSMFSPGSGRRFWPLDEWKANQKKQFDESIASMRRSIDNSN